jgi:hypothetical protein
MRHIFYLFLRIMFSFVIFSLPLRLHVFLHLFSSFFVAALKLWYWPCDKHFKFVVSSKLVLVDF